MTTNSSGARGGADGKVVVEDTLILRAKTWQLNNVTSESAWGDSDSQGYTNRKEARKDATGSFTGVFDTNRKPYAVFSPGDIVKLVLWENATDYYAFPCALIQGYDVTYDMDTKEVVEYTASWGADGIFYYPGQSGAPSETLPAS